MRKLILLPILLSSFSCATTNQTEVAVPSPSVSPIPPGGDMPISLPSNIKTYNDCMKHLLFADKYISASDYSSAEEEMEEAGKICDPNNPDYNYMKAVFLEAEEKEKEAYSYYYKAAKLYLGKKMMNQVFKCYSGMLSINPDGEEVKELRPYFQDDDY
jgi:tetratricopeptide (TPR) repeat protein